MHSDANHPSIRRFIGDVGRYGWLAWRNWDRDFAALSGFFSTHGSDREVLSLNVKRDEQDVSKKASGRRWEDNSARRTYPAVRS